MLLHEFDSNPIAMLDPTGVVQPVPGMPKIAVSCFASVTFDRMVQSLGGVEIAHVSSANIRFAVYKAVYGGAELALFMAPVGAPSCAAVLEELFVMGVETVVLFGNCGVLDRSIADCSIILPTSALRDEGTSFHYAPPSDEIPTDARYHPLFMAMLEELGVSCTLGKAWTTDGVYRETREKAARRRAQGCVCVDMECSAVAALAAFRRKEVLQFFYAGDNLDAEKWDPRSLSKHVRVEEKDRVAVLALEAALRIAREKQMI